MAYQPTYKEGAWSCWLCKKTFQPSAIVERAEEVHTNAHLARFLAHLFSSEQIRSAMYEYHRRTLVSAQLYGITTAVDKILLGETPAK